MPYTDYNEEAPRRVRIFQLEVEGGGVWVPATPNTDARAAALMQDKAAVRRLRAGDYVETAGSYGVRTRWRFVFLKFAEVP